jgi:hypothetical protein
MYVLTHTRKLTAMHKHTRSSKHEGNNDGDWNYILTKQPVAE